MIKSNYHIILNCLVLSILLFGCNPTSKLVQEYYSKHDNLLNKIEKDYKVLYEQNPLAIEFTDQSFNYISIEIITDAIKYIYEFGIKDERLKDTLLKYKINPLKVSELINNMRDLKCIWINMLDYYVEEQKNMLVFIAIRPVTMNSPFINRKYYILTYFSKLQYFDKDGNLLAKRKQKRLRQINGDLFQRINDKVCFTISERFR